MKIGFFDSGLGGLLILKAVAKHLPQYDYEYYGDTAHVPYGDRSEAEIYELTKAGVLHLFSRECVLVIIACNTASVETLRRLQDTLLVGDFIDRRILGVIIPTVEAVVSSPYKSVALFATKRTIDSGKYNREFMKLDESVSLINRALPELVPLIEAGKRDEAIALIVAETKTMKTAGAQAIILGCTHYCSLKDAVRAVMGGEGLVFTQDEIVPVRLEDYLVRHPEITSKLSETGKRDIVLSAHRHAYDERIAEFLGGVYMPEEN